MCLLTRLKGLHMDTAAANGVLAPSSPRYRTRMFAARHRLLKRRKYAVTSLVCNVLGKLTGACGGSGMWTRCRLSDKPEILAAL